jgi:hypothetical protein
VIKLKRYKCERNDTMIKIDKIQVMNLENAMRGARNPLNSWARSDSYYDEDGNYVSPDEIDNGEEDEETSQYDESQDASGEYYAEEEYSGGYTGYGGDDSGGNAGGNAGYGYYYYGQ